MKSLKDLGIIWNKDGEYRLAKDIHELNIPSTIQDVIMARVDSLPEDAKEVLQIGSVIEREFTHDLIKKVTALPEETLLSHLSLLKDLELIYERGIYPQSAYVFKHALTREIIYDSIFTRRRKQLHEQIGNAIETFYQGSLEENYEVLVEHFIKGENYEKGARYSKLGGAKADKAGSINATIDFAKKRISWSPHRGSAGTRLEAAPCARLAKRRAAAGAATS